MGYFADENAVFDAPILRSPSQFLSVPSKMGWKPSFRVHEWIRINLRAGRRSEGIGLDWSLAGSELSKCNDGEEDD